MPGPVVPEMSDFCKRITEEIFAPGLLDSMIGKTIEQLEEQRENLILKLIVEKTGIFIDIKEEAKKKFPRLRWVVEENKETLYFNNDTEEGLRIVTFLKTDPSSYFTGNDIPTIVVHLKWY